jgi:hypothetical protein
VRSLRDFSNFARLSFDWRQIVILLGIMVGLFITIYAMTVDPNSTTAEIGFPP